MKFKELKKGDTIYCIAVKNSEIIDGEIKHKIIDDICEYSGTDSFEIHFTDQTMIIPSKEEEYVIRGLGTLSSNLNPFNFTIYGTSHDLCAKAINKLVSTKIAQLTEDYKKIGIQMARLCMMSSVAKKIEKEASVILEPIYAD